MQQNKPSAYNSGYDDSTSYPSMTLWYKIVLKVGRHTIMPIVNRIYNVHTAKFDRKIVDPSLIVYNHGSNYDQLALITGIPQYKRYVASDALVRTKPMRITFKIISDFIYRRKGEKGDNVIRSAKATIEKGIHVCMSAEGGQGLNGCTAPIRPRTGQMVKDLGCGLVTYKLEGMYFTKPPWGVTRSKKGPFFGHLVNIYTRDEISKMTPEEINDLIYKDLYINQYEWQREKKYSYDRENRAEFMEYILYVCPKCQEIGHLHSHGDSFQCDCGYKMEVDEYGFYNGEDLVYDNLYEWDIWQREWVRDHMETWKQFPDKPFYHDDNGIFQYLDEKNNPVNIEEDVSIEMSPTFIRIYGKETDITFPLTDVRSITVAHRRDIAILVGNKYYQFSPKIPISPQKYKTALYLLRGKSHLSF